MSSIPNLKPEKASGIDLTFSEFGISWSKINHLLDQMNNMEGNSIIQKLYKNLKYTIYGDISVDDMSFIANLKPQKASGINLTFPKFRNYLEKSAKRWVAKLIIAC